MPARGMAVVAVLIAGQALFGLVAAVALVAARKRASKRAVIQVALIIGAVESFVLAVGAAAVNAARGGSEALTTGLLWYAAGGWIIVQVGICVWWFWAWWMGRGAEEH
ncbi:MAG: hypothetical protein HGB10_01130 [Coriobacteriia bacterium]|nr:hypothetical protein [Coriobacteriia bacterium]